MALNHAVEVWAEPHDIGNKFGIGWQDENGERHGWVMTPQVAQSLVDKMLEAIERSRQYG